MTHSSLTVAVSTVASSRRWKWGLGVALAFLTAAVVAYRATQWVPEFYARKLDVPIQRGNDPDDDWVTTLVDVHNVWQVDGAWQVQVDEAQVNRWLAEDLQKRFPRFLPPHASEPRIAISDGQCRVACQYDNGRISAVLSMAIEPFATDEPGVIGFRIRHARMGAVPGLTGTAVEQLTWAGRRARLQFRWTEEGGDPVALVRIPQDDPRRAGQVDVAGITMEAGQLLIHGVTTQPSADPEGAAGESIVRLAEEVTAR